MKYLTCGVQRPSVGLSTILMLVASLGWGEVSAQQAPKRGANAIATTVVNALPQTPLYWHLDTYPNRAAAEAAKGERSTVAESFDKVWLFTITDANWRPSTGTRVAMIGPLPSLGKGGTYTATYLNADTAPGFETDVHRHDGPEALYTLSGEVCVETPDGKMVGRAGGEPLLIPGNQPMRLKSVGTENRRSIVLVLHDPANNWKAPAADWVPKGLCGSS
ncbi:MAG: hypothetical protein WBQ05_09815 [Candidatus Competibacter denitrificans]